MFPIKMFLLNVSFTANRAIFNFEFLTWFNAYLVLWVKPLYLPCMELSHPVLRRRGDVAATSLCTSQRHRRYVSNETPNDVSMERRQDVSVVRLHDVLLERHNNVSKGRNNNAPSSRLHDVPNKSQMEHPTTSQWYVTKTSQWYVSTTSH